MLHTDTYSQSENKIPASLSNPDSRERHKAAQVLLEAFVVALLGALLAFLANSLSPRGLKLNHDYFPGSLAPSPPGTNAAQSLANAAQTTGAKLTPVEAKLKSLGLQFVESNQVVQLFHDSRVNQNLVVFLDARDDEHYRQGHIPGAYLFDHYHPEQYLSTVWPVCTIAQQIVVYCTGGDCEDSQFAALDLAQAGIPKEKLSVYIGGITEWTTNSLPVELGERNSGQFHTPNQ